MGSTSYITTKNGAISQHVEYIAFGEILFEEHSSSFSSPYLFNGKELDRETNLSYFGARYYDAKVSMWLNVDPLAEKFFNQSPYNYCFNNPIVMLDPDGKGPINPFRLGKPSHPKFTYDDGFLGKTATYTPQVRKPGFDDYASYTWWGIKTGVATVVRWDLGNALSAYRHFIGASGKNFTFDLPDYFDDDASGKTLLKNATNIAKKALKNY